MYISKIWNLKNGEEGPLSSPSKVKRELMKKVNILGWNFTVLHFQMFRGFLCKLFTPLINIITKHFWTGQLLWKLQSPSGLDNHSVEIFIEVAQVIRQPFWIHHTRSRQAFWKHHLHRWTRALPASIYKDLDCSHSSSDVQKRKSPTSCVQIHMARVRLMTSTSDEKMRKLLN